MMLFKFMLRPVNVWNRHPGERDCRMGQAQRMPWRRGLPLRHPACRELVQRAHHARRIDGPAALGPSYGYLDTGRVRISVQC